MQDITGTARAGAYGYPAGRGFERLEHFKRWEAQLRKIGSAPQRQAEVGYLSSQQCIPQAEQVLAAIEVTSIDKNLGGIGRRKFVEICEEIMSCGDVRN